MRYGVVVKAMKPPPPATSVRPDLEHARSMYQEAMGAEADDAAEVADADDAATAKGAAELASAADQMAAIRAEDSAPHRPSFAPNSLPPHTKRPARQPRPTRKKRATAQPAPKVGRISEA